MKLLCIISFLFFSLTSVLSQSMSEAERLFNDGKYFEATEIYTSLLLRNSTDARLNYRLGRCMIALKDYERAIIYFEYAAKKRFYKSYYFLYEAHYAMYSFDKAVEAIDMYIEKDDLTEDAKTAAYGLREKAVTASRMLGAVENIVVDDSVRLHKSQLLSVYNLTNSLGTVFYDSNDTVSQRVGYLTGREDKKIVTLLRDSMSALAVSYKLLDLWGDTTFLSDVINTQNDENFPFEMSDGVTLYFASKGHDAIGGYDIFMSRFNSSTNDYTKPLNLGMPFNSPANDYMLVIDDLSRRGWFATDRYQHEDSVVVYRFIPNEHHCKLDTDDIEYCKAVAQLKLYRKVEAFERDTLESVSRSREIAESIDFAISDDLMYRSVDQFRSIEAKNMYIELQRKYKRRNTLSILIEGKRREFKFSGIEGDKAVLRQEVLDLERDVMMLNDEIKDVVYKIRLLELSAIENN